MAIEAEGTFNVGDVWRGSLLASRKVMIFITVLGAAVIVFGVGGLVYEPQGEGSWSLILAGVFVWLFYWANLFYRSYRAVRKTPNLQGPVHFHFDDTGFSFDSLHVRAELKWGASVKWKESKSVFLVYQNPRLGNIIPKRFFSSHADVDAVRELLRAHVRK